MAIYQRIWFWIPIILIILYLLPKYSTGVAKRIRKYSSKNHFKPRFESFSSTSKNNNRYLNASETASIILFDGDGFLRRLNEPNLYARGAKTVQEYKTLGTRLAIDFSERQKDTLNLLTRRADGIINANRNRLRYFGLSERLLRTPWRFALTNGTQWEGGMPHTRDGTIFLSTHYFDNTHSQSDFVRTLIHERVHLYQKRYKREYNRWLLKRGYRVTNMSVPLMRMNPDCDHIIYKTPEGKYMYCVYHTPFPNNLHDITGDCSSEHPYEYFAYKCAKYLVP